MLKRHAVALALMASLGLSACTDMDSDYTGNYTGYAVGYSYPNYNWGSNYFAAYPGFVSNYDYYGPYRYRGYHPYRAYRGSWSAAHGVYHRR